jgi:hypothetical protein
MTDSLRRLWQRLFSQDPPAESGVARIAALQQAATARRAEYAAAREQAVRADAAPLPGALSACRTRMEEAETAHAAALQAWENWQSRQRSY